MTFLAPLWLLTGLLALAVLGLHMVRRRRIEVPSTFIWQRLNTTGGARQRLHPPRASWLLLLQLGIVVFAACALGLPLLGNSGASPRHSVYVLDASASMRATDVMPSRFEAAKTQLSSALAATRMGPQDRISIIAVEGSARLVAARHATLASAVSALGGIEPSDGAGGWAGLPSLLAGIVREGEVTTMLVVTDGADPAAGMDVRGLAIERRVIAGGEPDNAGLSAVFLPAGTNAWRAEGEVSFAGGLRSATVSASFLPEGGHNFIEWSSFEVARSGDARAVEFTEVFEFPSAGIAVLTLADDAAPYDNALGWVLHSGPRTFAALYVGDGNLALEQALLAVPGVRLFKSTTLPDNTLAYDLVVIDDVAVPAAPPTNTLWVGAARLEGEALPPAAAPVSVSGWRQEHPLADGVDWSVLEQELASHIPSLRGAEVLLEARDRPLVTARTLPSGREVRLAFLLEQGNWINQLGFPVFIANVVRWLRVDIGALADSPCIAGTKCPLEARLLTAPIRQPNGETLPPVAGQAVEWLPPGADGAFVPRHAGLYLVGDRVIAVHPPAAESMFSPHAIDPGAPPAASAPVPLWWWIAAAVLALLMIEGVLAGLGPEQYLRIGALMQRSPAGSRRRWLLGLRLGALAVTLAALIGAPLPILMPPEAIVLITDPTLEGGNLQRGALMARLPTPAHDSDLPGGLGVVALTDSGIVAADIGGPIQMPAALPPGGDIGGALLLALSMLPADMPGRIVLAADGHETRGGLAAAIPELAARGVPVDTLPFNDMMLGDIIVETVRAPARIQAGDTFPLDILVYSASGGAAVLTVFAEDEVVEQRTIELVPGRSRIESVVHVSEPGRVRYAVSIESADDAFVGNDQGGTVVAVGAAPRVALIASQANWGGYLSNALALQGLEVEVLGEQDMPITMPDWLGYDAVVLMNVPAIGISTLQRQQIEQLVRLHGRGLMILGGENSFGPGGYYGTPLESVSPLSARAPQEAPLASIVFIIDRSGSMGAAVGDVSRLDIARQATASAIELLAEDTRFGVVAFNNVADAVVPLQARSGASNVGEALASLTARGGTSLVVAMEQALDELGAVDAPIRHIVAMSDGLSQPLAFEAALSRALDMDVTLSIVAIGEVSDAGRLADIAKRGGGVFHQTRDFHALPSILAQEALMLNGDLLEKGATTAFWIDRDASFLSGFPDLPDIESYVRTSVKPGAALHLGVADENEAIVPLLASWRYGNGSVMALATHGAGPGTASWQQLTDFPLLWAQPLRHMLSGIRRAGLHVALQREGDEIVLDVTRLDTVGRPIGDKLPTAVLAGTDRQLPITLVPAGPGHYRGHIVAPASGIFEVVASAGSDTAVAAIDITYPAAFDFARLDHDRLVALSAATGGTVLVGDEKLLGEPTWGLRPAFHSWLLLMLALLLGDLFMRYAPRLLAAVSFRRLQPAPIKMSE